MKLSVLHEDNHILAVEKPSGLLSQGDHSGKRTVLDEAKDYIKKKYDKPGKVFLGPVHRLDRDVSGILVFARTSKAARRLHRQFLEGRVDKYYAAITESPRRIPAGGEWKELVHFLRKQRGFTEVSEEEVPGSKIGRLRFRRVEESGTRNLFLIKLITGRKHQIRSQFAHIDLPILGDEKYGGKSLGDDEGICLHAVSISFIHPVKSERMTLFSNLPSIFNSSGFTGPGSWEKITEFIREDLPAETKKH